MAFSSSLPEFCSESFLPKCTVSTLRRHSCDLHPIDSNQMPYVAEVPISTGDLCSSPSSKTNKQINIWTPKSDFPERGISLASLSQWDQAQKDVLYIKNTHWNNIYLLSLPTVKCKVKRNCYYISLYWLVCKSGRWGREASLSNWNEPVQPICRITDWLNETEQALKPQIQTEICSFKERRLVQSSPPHPSPSVSFISQGAINYHK